MSPQIISDLLVRMAPFVGEFVATVFQVEEQIAAQTQAIKEEVDSIFVYRTEVVGKLKSKFKNEDISKWDIAKIQTDLALLRSVAFPIAANDPDEERSISRVGAKLANLAKNWQNAPELILESKGYQYEGYEITEKAYILTNTLDFDELQMSIKASPERPLINPAFVIKAMDKNKSFRLMINDTEVSNYRAGYEDDNLVIWIPMKMMKETSLKVLF